MERFDPRVREMFATMTYKPNHEVYCSVHTYVQAAPQRVDLQSHFFMFQLYSSTVLTTLKPWHAMHTHHPSEGSAVYPQTCSNEEMIGKHALGSFLDTDSVLLHSSSTWGSLNENESLQVRMRDQIVLLHVASRNRHPASWGGCFER